MKPALLVIDVQNGAVEKVFIIHVYRIDSELCLSCQEDR